MEWKRKCLFQLEKYDEAIKCYDKAMEIQPNYSYAWSGKGNVYSNLKKYDEAIKCYDKAIELESDNVYAWNGKGNVYSN